MLLYKDGTNIPCVFDLSICNWNFIQRNTAERGGGTNSCRVAAKVFMLQPSPGDGMALQRDDGKAPAPENFSQGLSTLH